MGAFIVIAEEALVAAPLVPIPRYLGEEASHLPFSPHFAGLPFSRKSSTFLLQVRLSDLDHLTSGEFHPVSVLLDLLSPQPAEIRGTCAIQNRGL